MELFLQFLRTCTPQARKNRNDLPTHSPPLSPKKRKRPQKFLDSCGLLFLKGYYSHSIKRLICEWADISWVMFAVRFIGVENRGCFWFCRRAVGQSVKLKIPCCLLGFSLSLPFQLALRLQSYKNFVILTTSMCYTFSASSKAVAEKPGSVVIRCLKRLKDWKTVI